MRFSPILLVLFAISLAHGAELKPETLQAWRQYVHSAELTMQRRLEPGHKFLWIDENPKRAALLKSGQLLSEPIQGNGSFPVPEGTIHHWIGAAFAPNVKLDEMLAVIRDYARYDEYYKPLVVSSKAIEKSNDTASFAIRTLMRVMFVTSAMDVEYESRLVRLPGEQRCYIITRSTRIEDIQNYGQPDEKLLQPDQGSGYAWRLESIERYEERDGGVYFEVEAMGLSRPSPVALRLLVRAIAARLSRDSMLTSLEQTRAAVASSQASAQLATMPKPTAPNPTPSKSPQ
jgi:hypothetical protein